MPKVEEALKGHFQRHAADRNWPDWHTFGEVLGRLRESVENGVVPEPSDVAVAAMAVNLFADMQTRLTGQRREIARLNKERDTAWRAEGIKTIWLRLPKGQPVVAVMAYRSLIGLVTPYVQIEGQPYLTHPWTSGPDFNPKGERSYMQAVTEVLLSWQKRSKIRHMDLQPGWLPAKDAPSTGTFIGSDLATGRVDKAVVNASGVAVFADDGEPITHWQPWP